MDETAPGEGSGECSLARRMARTVVLLPMNEMLREPFIQTSFGPTILTGGSFCLFVFEVGFCYIAQSSQELSIFLVQPPSAQILG